MERDNQEQKALKNSDFFFFFIPNTAPNQNPAFRPFLFLEEVHVHTHLLTIVAFALPLRYAKTYAHTRTYMNPLFQ